MFGLSNVEELRDILVLLCPVCQAPQGWRVVGVGSDGGQHFPETDRKLYLDISVTHPRSTFPLHSESCHATVSPSLHNLPPLSQRSITDPKPSTHTSRAAWLEWDLTAVNVHSKGRYRICGWMRSIAVIILIIQCWSPKQFPPLSTAPPPLYRT